MHDITSMPGMISVKLYLGTNVASVFVNARDVLQASVNPLILYDGGYNPGKCRNGENCDHGNQGPMGRGGSVPGLQKNIEEDPR